MRSAVTRVFLFLFLFRLIPSSLCCVGVFALTSAQPRLRIAGHWYVWEQKVRYWAGSQSYRGCYIQPPWGYLSNSIVTLILCHIHPVSCCNANTWVIPFSLHVQTQKKPHSNVSMKTDRWTVVQTHRRRQEASASDTPADVVSGSFIWKLQSKQVNKSISERFGRTKETSKNQQEMRQHRQ